MNEHKIVADIFNKGGTPLDAAKAIGFGVAYVYKTFPDLIDHRKNNLKMERLKRDVAIVEAYLSGGKGVTIRSVAKSFGVSKSYVGKIVSKYFEKPEENLTLKSKV